MRITYEQLGTIIACMSHEQKQCDVTIEDRDGECRPASIRFVGSKDKQDGVLDESHPLIFISKIDGRARQYDLDVYIHDLVGQRIKPLFGASNGS